MTTPRNLVESLPLLAEFDTIQERINEATKQNRSYSLTDREKELCGTVMRERAEVSTHNVSKHMACCRNNDKEGSQEFHNAYCILPYKSTMLADYRKKFGEIDYPSPSASWEKEFNGAN